MPIRRHRMGVPLLVIALLGLTACATPEDEPAEQDLVDEGGSDPFLDAEDAEGLPEDDQVEDDETEEAGDETALTLDVATSEEYGEYLVDGDGLALYVSATDPPGESTCTDTCLQEWPVLSVGEEPTVADGVDEELVGTLERDDLDDDSFEQVTYRDKPLYYYRLDEGEGMTTGQGVDDRWFLIGPDGVEVRD